MVVVLEGSSDASRVTTATRIIAIDTPNDNALNTSWGVYCTSVNVIETAYNILSVVSTVVQDMVRPAWTTAPHQLSRKKHPPRTIKARSTMLIATGFCTETSNDETPKTTRFDAEKTANLRLKPNAAQSGWVA